MKKIFLLSIIASLFLFACNSIPLDTTVPQNNVTKSLPLTQGVWTQKADYIGGARYDFVGYALNNKGFIGTGRHSGYFSYLADWQEFDPILNAWVNKSSLAMPISGATGFTAANKGYIACGANDRTYIFDTYEFDALANSWNTKALLNMPRQRATGVGVGNLGYIIGGYNVMGGPMNDCLEYNQPLNTWSQRASLPLSASRYYSTGFSVNGKVYIFGGTAGINYLNDLWEFDTVNNTWIQKSSLPGAGRTQSLAFVINNEAYVIGGTNFSGYLNECWKYNPVSDLWIRLPDFPGTRGASGGVGFTINGLGYIVSGNGTSECWEYNPN